jgi:hypothetical protein
MDNVIIASQMTGKAERDLFADSICLQIFRQAGAGEVFSQVFIDELQHHGYRLSRGALCPSHEILGDQDESPKSRKSVRHPGAVPVQTPNVWH